jgi:hypothetical protein
MPFKFNPFTGTLDEVGAGSTSGGPFLPLAGGTMDTNADIAFDNGSRIHQTPGANGIDQVCSIDYVHRWSNGLLYILNQINQIRVVKYGMSLVPDSSYDSTLGFVVGSIFEQDDGNKYICTDATATAAVWHLLSSALPLTYAATLTPDCNDGLFRSVAMTGDLEINAPTNGVDGMRLRLRLVASGAARELTFQAAIIKPTGSTYEATVASGSYRIVELEYNGSFWMMTKNLEFPD